MIKQREDFEPFVEDDIPFEKHGRFPVGPWVLRNNPWVTTSISTPHPPSQGFGYINYGVYSANIVCLLCNRQHARQLDSIGLDDYALNNDD